MKLKKIKKAFEKLEREELAGIKKAIKIIDLKTEGQDWAGYYWKAEPNGLTVEHIRTKSGLTELEKTKTESEQRARLLKKETKAIKKQYQAYYNKLDKLGAVDYIPNRIEIAIDWTQSRTWGACPSASVWLSGAGFFTSRKVGGCGYDKRSTAAAEALAQSINMQALAFALLESWKLADIVGVFRSYKDLRAAFGYGLHFGKCYAAFGSGCGMCSILEELERLGYKVTARHEPNRGGDYYALEIDPKNKNYKTIKKNIERVEG